MGNAFNNDIFFVSEWTQGCYNNGDLQVDADPLRPLTSNPLKSSSDGTPMISAPSLMISRPLPSDSLDPSLASPPSATTLRRTWPSTPSESTNNSSDRTRNSRTSARKSMLPSTANFASEVTSVHLQNQLKKAKCLLISPLLRCTFVSVLLLLSPA